MGASLGGGGWLKARGAGLAGVLLAGALLAGAGVTVGATHASFPSWLTQAIPEKICIRTGAS